MKHIIFLFVTPALSGDEKKYKLQYLLDLGYKVDIVDLTYVIVPETDKAISHKRFNYKGIGYTKLFDKKEIKQYISNNRSAFFLPMFNDYFEVRKVYGLFTKYKIHYGYVNNLEADFDSSIPKEAVISKSKRIGIHHIIGAMYNRILRKISGKKNADFCAIGTQYGLNRVPKICACDKNTMLLMTHTFDYDRFYDVESYSNGGKRYAVFIDQYVPYHPDLTVDADIHLDTEVYYQEVCKILNAISKKENIEIIIAAHPRSDYRDKPECYPGYQIEYGRTTELIKGATFVMGHFSTALGMAVLAYKPIIIIENDVIASIKAYEKLCIAYSEKFNSPLVKNDKDIDNIWLDVDYARYEAYLKQFMTTGENNNKNIWDLVDDFVKSNGKIYNTLRRR